MEEVTNQIYDIFLEIQCLGYSIQGRERADLSSPGILLAMWVAQNKTSRWHEDDCTGHGADGGNLVHIWSCRRVVHWYWGFTAPTPTPIIETTPHPSSKKNALLQLRALRLDPWTADWSGVGVMKASSWHMKEVHYVTCHRTTLHYITFD